MGFEVNLAIRIKYYLKMAKTKIVPTNIREVLSHSMKQFNHEMEYYFQKRKAIETSVALKLKMNELERKRKEMELKQNKLDLKRKDIDQKLKQEEENAELEEKVTRAADQRGPPEPEADQPTEHVVEKESCPTKAQSVITEKMLKTTEVASLNKERGEPRRDKPAGGGFPNVGCTNSDCSLVGSRRCAGCQSSLYCGEVRSISLLKTRARSVNIVNIFHAGLCFSRLGCAQKKVQGQGQGEEDEEGQVFRGGLRRSAG